MALINSIKTASTTNNIGLPYGVSSTAAATAAKTVTVNGFSLETGAMVMVKFTYANSATAPTLNVNSTGAKSIMKYDGATCETWEAGAIINFIYDGTNWVAEYQGIQLPDLTDDGVLYWTTTPTTIVAEEVEF